jgi:hypothetical protein
LGLITVTAITQKVPLLQLKLLCRPIMTATTVMMATIAKTVITMSDRPMTT